MIQVHIKPIPDVIFPLTSVLPFSHGKMKITMNEINWLPMEIINALIDLTELGQERLRRRAYK